MLEHLAADDSTVVVFSPRYGSQTRYLDKFRWVNPPVVLDRAVPFVSLLKGVDLVVSSGGTMLREAAWLGVPAYSIFKSKLGSVDRYLQSVGRLQFISSSDEFPKIHLARSTTPVTRMHRPDVPERLAEAILAHVQQA